MTRLNYAVELIAPELFETVRRPVIRPGPEQVLIRVTECGVCGSDVKMYKGNHPVHRPPLLLGHELIGEVADLPAAYRGSFSTGDPVAVYPVITCGECFACTHGSPHVCPRMRLIGGHEPGGLARFVNVPAVNTIQIPCALPRDRRVLIEPMAVAVHGVNRAEVRPDEIALVIGCGPIGLMTALVLRAFGCARIVLSEISQERLRWARYFGFEDLIDSSGEDLPEALESRGFSEGVDVVFDCVGAATTLGIGMGALVPTGRLILVGVPPATIHLDSVLFQRGERNLVGSMLYSKDEFRKAMSLLEAGIISDEVMASGFVRTDFLLEEASHAFALLASGQSSALKTVIVHDREPST